jgi:hypothetical protein
MEIIRESRSLPGFWTHLSMSAKIAESLTEHYEHNFGLRSSE